MEPRKVDSGSQAYKVKICPGCGSRDSILYWESDNKQKTLTDGYLEVSKKLRRPECSRCGKVFEKGEEFKEESRRL